MSDNCEYSTVLKQRAAKIMLFQGTFLIVYMRMYSSFSFRPIDLLIKRHKNGIIIQDILNSEVIYYQAELVLHAPCIRSISLSLSKTCSQFAQLRQTRKLKRGQDESMFSLHTGLELRGSLLRGELD